MTTKAKHMARAPQLPSGCVDFNKLHHAAMTNTDPVKALAGARIVPAQEKPVVTPASTKQETPSNG